MDFVEVVPISALSGDNVELLGERMLAHLPEGPPLYPEDYLTTSRSASSPCSRVVGPS